MGLTRQYQHHGSTAGVVLRLCKSIGHSGRAVVMDAGFCVLEALIQLRRELAVFGCIMIKKRGSWPKHVPCERVLQHYADKTVGEADALPGKYKGEEFHIVAWKKPEYVTIMMTTFGNLQEEGAIQVSHSV